MHLPGGKKPRLVNPQHLSEATDWSSSSAWNRWNVSALENPSDLSTPTAELDGASIITELPESVSIAATISRERVVFPLPAGPCSVVTRSFDSRTACTARDCSSLFATTSERISQACPRPIGSWAP